MIEEHAGARVAYFDCFAGASGDMILGALLDAGLPLDDLNATLRTLPLPDWEITVEPVRRGAIGATLARVVTAEREPPRRRLPDVLGLIEAARLPGQAAALARAIFIALAESEARVHRIGVNEVHFHEVGAADAMLDICGAASGLALLDVAQVYCSPIPLTTGTVTSAHGLLPLPAPATIELLARTGAPTVPHPGRQELVTPTGAAILTTLARFERPAMRIRAAGYGAGSREEPAPNVLRLILGESVEQPVRDMADEPLTLLDCNLDDMNPQWYGHLFEILFERGALDVTCAPVLMKKGRPGQLLSVLCRPERVDTLIGALLAETTTLGVRRSHVWRSAAARGMATVETAYGPVSVKLRIVEGRVTQATPEYEDCKSLARALGVPLAAVIHAAQVAAQPLLGSTAAERE